MRYIVILVFFILQALVLLTAARKNELIVAFDAEARDDSVRQIAAAANNYYTETNTYPASIAALTAATGYEYLRTTARPFQALAIVNNLDDTVFKFNRIAVYTQDAYNTPLTDTEYLSAANNTCGTGAFSTATDWCGPSGNTQWWKHETRENIPLAIEQERRRLFRVLQKFNSWYNDDVSVSTTNGVWGNNYPDPGVPAANLKSLVAGFVQTATTCTGMYTWKQIPLDCSDLFSVWGTPTTYNYISSSHITLITKTPYTKTDGTPLYVSTEESL